MKNSTNVDKSTCCSESSCETDAAMRNEDPMSGQAGAHPVGAGVGAAIAGMAGGAAAGMIAGPVGTVVGAIAGGIAGGLGGKALAEEIDPTVEINYWRGAYQSRSYYKPALPFESIAPAYRFGIDHYEPGGTFEEREGVLRAAWETTKESATIGWKSVRDAVKDSWDRVASRQTDPGATSAVRKPR